MLLKRKSHIFIPVILLFVFASVLQLKANYAGSSQKKLQQQKLEVLNRYIQSIPSLLVLSGNTAKDLEAYSGHMTGILNTCQQIQELAASSKGNQLTEDSSRLCADLIPVVIYSRALYQSTEEYLQTNTQDWPSTSQPEFQPHLRNIIQTIKSTSAALRQLNRAELQDPALAELLTQLELAEQLGAETQMAMDQNNPNLGNQKLSELLKEVDKDKQDFLNARNYFWNNTVHLKALQKTTAKLNESSQAADY